MPDFTTVSVGLDVHARSIRLAAVRADELLEECTLPYDEGAVEGVLRRWLAGVRQIVETVYDKLCHTFRLDRERPHDLSGSRARLAAKIALHNFCIWLNEQLGRPLLAFTDLVDW